MKLGKNSLFLIIIGFALFLLKPETVQAQLAGTNLSEFQLGNLPGEEPKSLSSLYNQLNLTYRQKNLLVKTKIEGFYPSVGDNRSYTSLSQYSIQYADKGLKIQAGTLYQTIGRGLLLRSYEQPSAIWESRGYRVRYGFHKDLQGVAASYTNNKLKIKLLRGRVLAVDLPPTLSQIERRPDLVEGGEFNYTLKDQTLGIAYIRHTNGDNTGHFLTAYADGFYKSVSYYGEFAFGADEARAAYGGLSYSNSSLGLSLEYKDYNNFLIGAGINDPPTLVKEHSSRLLNRSTHVPLLRNESGYQIELSYAFKNSSQLTLNHSLAQNKFSPELEFIFHEYYIDYTKYFGESIYSKIFVDFAIDPFTGEKQRYTGGFIIEKEFSEYTGGLDLEVQAVQRDFGIIENFQNLYAGLSLNKGSKFGASVLIEASNDSFLKESDDEANWQFYPGIILNYKPVQSTIISLFAGKRRGGPACNSGVCYDVLDFQGIELRLSTTF